MTQKHRNKSMDQSLSSAGKLEKISTIIRSSSISSESDEESSTKQQGGSSKLEVSAEEQLKIIEQTGILDKLTSSTASSSKTSLPRKPLIEFSTQDLNSFEKFKSSVAKEKEEEQDKTPTDTLPLWVDRAFDTFLWSIPFNTVFICLDVAIHAQYGQPVTFLSELNRLKNVFPTSLFIIHYNLHHSDQILSKLILFSLSTIGGSYMIYAMNKLSYLLVLKRVPSLGALWIFAVVRMNLVQCIFSLLLVLLWCWVMNLSLYV